MAKQKTTRIHFEKYWMCKAGRIFLIPVIEISVEQNFWFDEEEKGPYVLSFEIRFLNRWCAIELGLRRKEVHHGN